MSRTANEMWIQIQVEQSKVESMVSQLVREDNATYGGPLDYCRQFDSLTGRMADDLRHALSNMQYLRFRLEAFLENKAKEPAP